MADEHSTSTEKRTGAAVASGGSLAEGLIGIGAVVLAIIAFANVFPTVLLCIAIIAAGVALLFEAGSLSARYSRLGTTRTDVSVRRGGTAVVSIGGILVIALGILSVIGVAPRWLIPIAIMLTGVSLVLSSGIGGRVSALEVSETPGFGTTHETVREAGISMVTIESFVGFATLILGVLALIGVHPLVLSLVAIIGVGCAQFLDSSAASTAIGSLRR